MRKIAKKFLNVVGAINSKLQLCIASILSYIEHSTIGFAYKYFCYRSYEKNMLISKKICDEIPPMETITKTDWGYYRELEKKFLRVMDELKNKLSSEDIEYILDLFEHNEMGVAYEHLCVQLNEYYIPISKELYDEISELGKTMDIEASYYTDLEELIK